ncbi:MAG: SoxR reducing system RseC family protein [Mariprofundus sp.]
MQQVGVVLKLEGGRALVAGERASACGSCAGKSSCTTLGAWNDRVLELEVRNDRGAKVGDEVLIEVPDRLILKSACALYGLPMVFFFAAGIIAYLASHALGMGSPDLWAAISGLAAVVIYYLSKVLNGAEEKGLDARIVRIQSMHELITLDCHYPEIEGQTGR